MIIYWGLFIVPAFAALWEGVKYRTRFFHPVIFFLIALIILMGTRESGGDFYTYNLMIERFSLLSVTEWMSLTEPIYGLLNWLSIRFGLGIYGVNSVCALFFVICLYIYALDEPKPLLFLAVAIPYLVIVVAIGYTRQGTAIGFFMLALTYLRRKRLVLYIICCLIAVGFHSSAVIALPFSYFAVKSTNKIMLLGTVIISIFAFIYLLEGTFDEYIRFYIQGDRYESGGALQRSLISGIAGIILMLNRAQWKKAFADYNVFFIMALITFMLVPLSLVQSTVADRMGLFLLPFQLVAFSRLPILLVDKNLQRLSSIAVIAGYTLVLYVWLHHGTYSQALWLPYSSSLIGVFP